MPAKIAFSPLANDLEYAKELNITEDIELAREFKIAYLRAQIEEVKKMQWRSRVDAVLDDNLINSTTDEALVDNARSNRTRHRSETKQYVIALRGFAKLLGELEAQE